MKLQNIKNRLVKVAKNFFTRQKKNKFQLSKREMKRMFKYIRGEKEETKLKRSWNKFSDIFSSNKWMFFFIVFVPFAFLLYKITNILLNKYVIFPHEIESGVYIEAFGMLFDILIFGVILSLYDKFTEKRRNIQRYVEEIDDFRHWESEEAKFKIIGNIKRLSRLRKKDLDLSYCYLPKTNLSNLNLENASFNGANLEQVSIDGSDSNLNYVKFFGCKFNQVLIRDAFGFRIKFQGLRSKNPCIYECKFNQARISDCKFFQVDEDSPHFGNPDSPNFTNSEFLRSEITDSEFISAAFMWTNFEGSEFWRTKFNGSHFREIKLKDVVMRKCDLSETEGLTYEQLAETKNLFGTIGIDPEIESRLRSEKPELFIDQLKEIVEEIQSID